MYRDSTHVARLFEEGATLSSFLIMTFVSFTQVRHDDLFNERRLRLFPDEKALFSCCLTTWSCMVLLFVALYASHLKASQHEKHLIDEVLELLFTEDRRVAQGRATQAIVPYNGPGAYVAARPSSSQSLDAIGDGEAEDAIDDGDADMSYSGAIDDLLKQDYVNFIWSCVWSLCVCACMVFADLS